MFPWDLSQQTSVQIARREQVGAVYELYLTFLMEMNR